MRRELRRREAESQPQKLNRHKERYDMRGKKGSSNIWSKRKRSLKVASTKEQGKCGKNWESVNIRRPKSKKGKMRRKKDFNMKKRKDREKAVGKGTRPS